MIGSGVFVLILFLIQLSYPHFLPALFTGFVRPFWREQFSIASGSLKSPEALLAENESLKRTLAEYDIRLSTIKAIESENEELKSSFSKVSLPVSTSTKNSKVSVFKSQKTKILSAVLQRPPISGYGYMIIDGGQDFGFVPGNSVYAPGDVLIGKISDVLGQTSKVSLFSSPSSKYEVLIGSHHQPASAIGRGGGQYGADLPRDSGIVEGDIVIASSLNDKPFGVVSGILSDSTQPFETILFAPPSNIYSLRWVLVDNNQK